MKAIEYLDDRKLIHDAATPGPWYWRNTSIPYLMGGRSQVVMAFERMGMQGAQPVFRGDDNVLVPAGKENINDFPDAYAIVDAHNHLPHMEAALRAVLAEADALDEMADDNLVLSEEAQAVARLAARGIRNKVAAALGVES